MTTRDREAFGKFMFALGEAFGEEISAARIEIYFAALGDLALDDIRRSATTHVRESKFFPKVAELREAAAGSVTDRAELAWLELVRQVRRVGAYGRPTFSDPAIERAAVELYGGWGELCRRLPGEGPELLGAAKLFKSTYVAWTKRDLRNAALGPSHGEAHDALASLREQLEARGLPTHDMLPRRPQLVRRSS